MTCNLGVLRRWRRMSIASLLGLCSLCAVAGSLPQGEPEDGTRRIWKKRFREARARTRSRRPNRAAVNGELIGVTIWRLREGQSRPIAERATADTLFNEGERVRLSIEAPRESDNYLYVIDREVYADGTTSDPYLIFPSRSTPKGGNVMTAGKLVFVPARGDEYPYFSLVRAREDQLSEDLTIIISPKPLKLPISGLTDPVRLESKQVAQWEKQWGGRVEHWEEQDGVGKQWTDAEKEADKGERRLRQGDPLPQTIYLLKAKPGAPMMLRVSLRVAPGSDSR
jgi:hypothetical protein